MVLAGSPADYDEWGPGWSYEDLRPHLERATSDAPHGAREHRASGPFHRAFLDAAQALGFPLLDDPDDPGHPVGVAPFPANVVDGQRCAGAAIGEGAATGAGAETGAGAAANVTRAITVPIDTLSPLLTTISSNVPVTPAGTSIAALSVSSVISGASALDRVARLNVHLDDLRRP